MAKYRPQCDECGGFCVQTVEWVVWSADGTPTVNTSGDSPPGDSWCDDCEADVEVSWVEVKA
jgi:hypothetical protein